TLPRSPAEKVARNVGLCFCFAHDLKDVAPFLSMWLLPLEGPGLRDLGLPPPRKTRLPPAFEDFLKDWGKPLLQAGRLGPGGEGREGAEGSTSHPGPGFGSYS
ncbi:UNVERIFIED_CONTAM: hypothetical protein K2H54_069360, partial [Gekko kuhli]